MTDGEFYSLSASLDHSNLRETLGLTIILSGCAHPHQTILQGSIRLCIFDQISNGFMGLSNISVALCLCVFRKETY